MQTPTHFLATGALALAFAGCVGTLGLPPPLETYDFVEPETVPALTSDQQKLVDAVNARLVKEGFPAAKVGGYEMDVAKLQVAIWNQKRWSTSHRKLDATLVPDPDEPEGTEGAKLHLVHSLLARGVMVPSSVWMALHGDEFPKHVLSDTDLDKMWPFLHPDGKPNGELRIGVAILGDGLDNKRYFAVIIHDHYLDLEKGPPRTAAAGSSFEIRGRLLANDLRPLTLAVQHPDGKVDLHPVDVKDDGQFTETYQLPADTGLYLVSIGVNTSMFQAPVYAGVQPTPWPAFAAVDATDPDNVRGAAKEFATAAAAWRKSLGLAPVPLPAELCAFARTEAQRAADQAISPMTVEGARKGWKDRAKAAGLDPDKMHWFWSRVTMSPADETSLFHSWSSYVTRAPWTPFNAAVLGSPTLAQLGIGAVAEPQKSTDDPLFVDLVWMSVEAAENPPSAPAAAR